MRRSARTRSRRHAPSARCCHSRVSCSRSSTAAQRAASSSRSSRSSSCPSSWSARGSRSMRSSRSMPSDSRRPSSATEMTVGRGGVSPLDQAAQFLKGVGPKRAELLARLDIRTARDLLFHVPRRYEDVSTVTRIGKVEIGQDATVIGEVVAKGVLPTRSGLRIFQAVLRDSSGQIEASWPGQPFLDRTIRKGDLLLVTGPVRFFHGRQITPREYVILGRAGEEGDATGKVLPIYPATEGLSQRLLRSIIEQNLDALLPALD